MYNRDVKESMGLKLNNSKLIISNSASAYHEFFSEYKVILNDISSGFHSDGTFNISVINGLNSQLKI